MGISELLWACRRRWRLIVTALALALAIGWLTTPASASVSQKNNQNVSFHTTVIMVPSAAGTSLDRLALLATVGEVPSSVRRAVGAKAVQNGDAQINRNTGGRSVEIGSTRVAVTPDRAAKALRITANDASAKRAVGVAQAISLKLMTAANADALGAYNANYKILDDYRVQLRQAEATLNDKSTSRPPRRCRPTRGRSTARTKAVLRELSDVQERILRPRADPKPSGAAARR